MINALVVDLEHWHSPELLKGYLPAERPDQIEASIRPILSLLDKYRVRATFSVLGTVARDHPNLVREMYDMGHEIASHAWSHRTLYELGPENFEVEIAKSVDLLRSITGENPVGFRAPSFSIDNSTKWAFEVLERYQFKYDASVFPIKTMLYGVPNAPLHIYRPSHDDITIDDPSGKIVEFPMTVIRAGWNLPFAGGFYLRILPFKIIKFGIKRVNKERPAIIYIHPWEIYSETIQVDLPPFPRFITYYGIRSSIRKLEGLLREFEFTSIRECLNYYSYL